MRFVELFGGIGGFSLALQREGFKCVGYYEIDKYCCQTYNKNFGTDYEPTDVRKTKADEIEDCEIITAGFPCQSFSIAGKRKGFQDTRGTLFYEICRIVEAKRPRLLLFENVKGLLSADDGRCFATIISSLEKLGYLVEWQVLNTKNFGIPQNRERVFIVGHLGKESAEAIFPIGRSNTANDTPGKERELRSTNTISSGYYKRGSGKNIVVPILTPNRMEKRQNGRRFKEEGEEMFTLTGQDIHGVMLRDGRDNRSCLRSGRTPEVGFKGKSIRRLTPRECERLQGFPDDWTKGVSDTQRYRQCGNAVTVAVVQQIAKKIRKKWGLSTLTPSEKEGHIISVKRESFEDSPNSPQLDKGSLGGELRLTQ
jgi:DNA (cytosine-5)-methyltransferase 1|tara:strand:+ start:278 stop:1381 length:1104 start_codon:yes stop_codon:yes gene_type:complete